MAKNSLSKVFYLETKYWLRDYYVFVFLEIKVLEKYRPYSTLKVEFETLHEMILNMSLTSMMNLTGIIFSKLQHCVYLFALFV